MLIFVYGDDTFRGREKVQEMKKRFGEKFDPSGMNLAEFKDKPQIGEVMQAVQSPPFLGKKRMTIIRDLVASTKKADATEWLAGFQKTPDSSIVIFWEGSEPKKVEAGEIFKVLKKSADVFLYCFPALSDAELIKWIAERAALLKLSIDRPALNEMAVRVGPDLWRMQLELEKLKAFVGDAVATIDAVCQMVHPNFDDKIFDFVDAVSRRDNQAALKLLHEERLSGASDHHLLSMLTRQVRILLGARALLEQNSRATKDELAQAMHLHPYVAQKSLQQAKTFNLNALKAAHSILFQYDLGMKSGKITPKLAVDLTLAQFLSANDQA